MAFSNLTRIILYIVAGISLVVVLFFYVGPNTVDVDEMELRVTEAANPVDMTPVAPLPTVDTTATDSTAIAEEAPAEEVVAVTTPAIEAKSAREVLSGWEYFVWLRTDIILVWAYLLVLFALLSAIIFPMIAVASNTKALIRLGLVLAATAIIVVISYLMSDDTPMEIIGYTGTGNSDPGTLKMIDTVLFVTYMLFGLALASILYSIISKAFK
jgi:hypothetical protein